MDIIEKILKRGVEEIIVKSHLEKALKTGKKLRVKFGIDPTAPELHLGHTVVLRKLRQFQDAGHKAVLIIGDFTAQIGDPAGRAEARKPLSPQEVKKNLKNYLRQAGRVIDLKKTEIHYNSEWHEKGGLKNLLKLTKSATVQQVLERDDFEKRLQAGNKISVLEILYPLLQGYDSVAIKADVELGGTDQKFNLLMGRRVQRYFGMKEQDILTVPLIEGTDGRRKMSKSFGNYIAIEEKPNEMFGKLMAVPDSLIKKYFETLTDVDPPKKAKPYAAKLLLAETITALYHGEAEAKKAKEEFLRIFSRKEIEAAKLPPLKLGKMLSWLAVDLVLKSGLVKSKSAARRLIEQGGFELNGEKIKDPQKETQLKSGDVVKIGKKNFFRIEH